MAKNYKYITYIVIIISLGIFVSTQILKQMSQKNYLELENLMSSLKLEETPGNEREKIREKCLPFTYFDQETYNQTEQLLIVMSNAAMTVEDIEKEVYKLQRLLNARQQKLLFSFDMLLYFSLVLVLIAMVVIVYDLLSEKNEADRIQAVNQEQLKFSRDLHDGIAQDLAALKVYLQKKG